MPVTALPLHSDQHLEAFLPVTAGWLLHACVGQTISAWDCYFVLRERDGGEGQGGGEVNTSQNRVILLLGSKKRQLHWGDCANASMKH